MAESVYLLGALTSLACALLLFRAYRAGRVRLLLWSALCFGGLAMNNLLLFVDVLTPAALDLRIPRIATALVAVSLLVYGLVWEET